MGARRVHVPCEKVIGSLGTELDKYIECVHLFDSSGVDKLALAGASQLPAL